MTVPASSHTEEVDGYIWEVHAYTSIPESRPGHVPGQDGGSSVSRELDREPFSHSGDSCSFFRFFLYLLTVAFFFAACIAPGMAVASASSNSSTYRHVLGQRIREGVVINLPAFRLTFYEDWAPVKTYRVAIGRRSDPTPVGYFTVATKVVNPTWYPTRGGEPVPPGEKNPVGSRWIGLNVLNYGIHGTNSPASIGKDVSLGCIRLHHDEIEELFERVKSGMMVLIVYERAEMWVDELTGERSLAIHPDVYGYQPVLREMVVSRLNRAGLEPELLMPYLEKTLDFSKPVRSTVVIRLGIPVYAGNRNVLMAKYEPGLGTVLPLRQLAERFNNKALEYDGTSNRVLLDGEPVEGVIRDGRTYIPLNEVTRLFGLSVWWDPVTTALRVSAHDDQH